MALFPTNKTPISATPLVGPQPLIGEGSHGGRITTREVVAIGFTWQEEYLVNTRDVLDKQWLAQVSMLAGRGHIITNKTHVDNRDLLGTGNGTPIVLSAQTGNDIASTGWASSELVLLPGDLVQFGNGNPVFQITSPVMSNATPAGVTTLPIYPGIFGSITPTGGLSVITTPNVQFKCVIDQPLDLPSSGIEDFIVVTVSFRETL